MDRTSWEAPRIEVIVGRPATGKTSHLVGKALTLLDEGTFPCDIALFAATPAAADRVADLLRAALGTECELPRVTTLPAFERELLASPEARALTGRRGRTLLAFEQDMLMEDMKTSRVAPRRLGEMLRFFYRSWADLEPMEGDWFYSDEEQRVYTLLERHLRYREAYHPAEVARAAWDFATAAPETLEAHRFDHVLVDDYQMLSRASQQLAELLARESLTIAGDHTARVHGLEEFPYPQGLADAAAREGVLLRELDRCHAARSVAQGTNRLAADEALGSLAELLCATSESGRCEALAYDRIEDEQAGVCDAVRRHLEAGEAAEDIVVVAPSRAWIGPLAQGLAAAGIPAAPVQRLAIARSGRNGKASAEARAVTLLRLAADGNDPLAVRTWCGFGDYLGASALFAALAETGAKPRIGDGEWLPPASSALAAQQTDHVRTALAEAQTLLDDLGRAEHRGRDLAEAAWHAATPAPDAPLPAILAAAAAQAGDVADADQLCRAIERTCLEPRFVGEGVRVGVAEDMAGLAFDTVIMTGMVNGLTLPRRYFDPAQLERDRRPALLSREMAKAHACAGKARSTLLFTYFLEAPLARAESMKLKIDRVRLRRGERVCALQPSETIRAITGVYYHD